MFLKVRLSKGAVGGAKTIYLDVLADRPTALLGRKVDPITLDDGSYTRADGTMVDVKHLIVKEAIAWVQPMREDRVYGNLVPDGPRRKP